MTTGGVFGLKKIGFDEIVTLIKLFEVEISTVHYRI